MKRYFVFNLSTLMMVVALLVTTSMKGYAAEDVLSLYAKNMTATPGQSSSLAICIDNTTKTLRGFQFDLYLPQGVSAVVDSKQQYVYTLSPRLDSNKFTVQMTRQSNGAIRIIAYSMDTDATISGTSGAIINIPLSLASSVAIGSQLSVNIKDIFVTTAKPTAEVSLPATTVTITAASSNTGDINNDGKVDVSDIVSLVSYLNGKTPSNFNVSAANVDGKNGINVDDVTALQRSILKK